jgi:hypothetical protein
MTFNYQDRIDREGMSRRLLKFGGGSGDNYAT